MHEEHGKRSHADVFEAVTGIAVTRVWNLSEALAQLLNEDVDREFHSQFYIKNGCKVQVQ